MAWQIGVDVGGTFTDLLARDPGQIGFKLGEPGDEADRLVLYRKSVGRWDVNRGPASTLPGAARFTFAENCE